MNPSFPGWRARAGEVTHVALVGMAAVYLAGVWLEGEGSTLPSRVVEQPGLSFLRTPLYFTQIAALFPHAAVNVIDYRAEGWVCREHAWRELDTRAYFPLDPDDKENRFQRVMHFFRDDRVTMHALDEYIVAEHARGGRTDGIDERETLGGIRVLALRLPIPEPGAPLSRMVREPLPEYPASVRKNFYYTRQSTRAERCGYRAAPLAPDSPLPPVPDREAPP